MINKNKLSSIALGYDDAGSNLVQFLSSYLNSQNWSFSLTHHHDYPEAAKTVIQKIQHCEADKGILICGTGIGMSIIANRWSHIRAALVHNVEQARLSREHNDANVLCLGGRIIDEATAKEILEIWFETDFSNEERHFRRLDQIKSLSTMRRLRS
jgi:ribose 5-phosphate isomerase B